ncbi:DNA primase [Sideroxydans sp. CL21]|uniref:DNA primase n=1 Tax=Sideroxydans sp. CL21 TaxID=2600596 RepID=UPI0024BC9975|nr:DNA primase [Sideroxydans sp. CL21]
MIPKSFIQDLLNRLDIVDVIERYLPLKKAGANFVACCPFHNEKSPSFTVSQTKQFYHCFGCGAHGTAIGFVMEHTGMGFVEAVEDLAKSIGVSVPQEASNVPQHKVAPDLYDLMQSATRYYREQLKKTPRAIEYLKGRGLSGEVAARFGIGYAPDDWQNLKTAVPNYQDASLVETGLVIAGEEGKRYDRFRDRIMFPIVNVRGQVIGFGGRVLDKGEPKYLNSPETPLFEKGHELYGLYQAQKSIRAQQRVIVVEGYMDVVALAQHGVEYAVATLGTATTPFHVQKLLRLCDQVVFCFDGDKPGQKAAWRALENALPQLVDGKRIGFLFLPEEHDPDTYIREFGTEAFEHELENSLPLSGYLLRELTADVDLRTQEGRSALLKNAQPLLTAITAPTTALLLRKEVAALAGVTQAELEALYVIKPIAAPQRQAPQKAKRAAPSGLRILLRCLVMKPELARELPRDFHGEGNEGAAIAALVDWLNESADETSTAAMIQHFQGTLHGPVFANAQGEVIHWGEDFDILAEFTGIMRKIRRDAIETEMSMLQAKGLAMNELERVRHDELKEELKQLRAQVG